MRDKLSALQGISPEEELKISMLLAQSVFIGIFIGAFDITAYTLLLSTFDEKLMARGYIVSGVVGFILTSICLKLRSKSDTGKFTAGNLIFILAITALLWLTISYSGQKWVIFLLFVMLAPLNILSFLGFWRIAERVFKGKPDKVFRFLEGGLIAGIMIVSFVILVISFKVQTHNILFLSILSIFSALVVQFLINKQFDLNPAEDEDYTEDIIKRIPLLDRRDPYKNALGIFAALSVLATFIIQYIFMAVTRKQFPVSQDMAAFLGLFTGIMMIVSLFAKFVVFPFLRHHFNVNVILLVSPVVVAGLSLISIVSCFAMNKMQAAGGYLVIVLLLGFNRLVSKSFIDSVEIPSYKIIYQFLNKKTGREIQSEIDGTANEMGLIFSGIILAGFGIFSFINLLHFSILLLVISLISVFVGIKLLKKYRSSLKNTRSNESEQESEKLPALKSKFISGLEFRKDYFRIISGNYSSLNSITPTYFNELSAYALSKNDINLIPALRKIVSNPLLEADVRQQSLVIIDNLNKKNIAADEGIKLLAGTRLPQTTEILRLLRNNSLESKRQAIHIIGKFRICDLLSVVCESLNTPGLSHDAYEILLSFGEGVEDELVRFYLINSGNLKLSRLILQLLGNICSKESTGFLFSHLWSNSRQIKEISIKSLLNCGFKPTVEEKIRLDNLIFDTIGIITWNMGAEIILEQQKNEFLLDVIRQENERWFSFLFRILSLTYGKDHINVVRKNLAEGKMESTSHALEIVREMVSDSIKPMLVILLDDLPVRKKMKKLSGYYPAEVSGHKNLAEDIINRDYNLISIWAKACTLRNINKIEGREMSESVAALLFSPEEIIREEAAYLIARSNPGLYISASERIPSQVKRKLDKILDGTFNKKGMLFEKVHFLKESFSGIPAWELFTLAGELHFINDQDEDSGAFESGSILWFLNGEQSKHNAEIIYNGTAEISNLGGSAEFPVYRLSLASIEEFQFQYPHNSDKLLGYVDKIHETF
jgi:ATP:ADP antiporter, AAA family